MQAAFSGKPQFDQKKSIFALANFDTSMYTYKKPN